MVFTTIFVFIFLLYFHKDYLKKDKIKSEGEACKTHNKIGKIVRNAIKQAGGTMPEELPTPEKSLKELEKENKKMLKEDT